MRRKSYLQAFVVILILSSAVDQTRALDFPDISFEVFDQSNGLKSSAISSIAQDSKGFLWLGSHNGLYRFDGRNFLTMEHDPFDLNSLPNNVVQTLYLDGDYLWIGTYSGLARLDLKNYQIIRYQNSENLVSSLSNNIVTAIVRTNDGKLWVGTLDGLNLLNEGDGSFERFFTSSENLPNTEHHKIRSLLDDNQGSLWIGTGNGVFRRSLMDGIIKHYPADQSGLKGTLGEFVMHMTMDSSETIWFASWPGGLSQYERGSDSFKSYRFKEDLRFYSLVCAENGLVYAGTWGGGLFVLDPKNGDYRHLSRKEQTKSGLKNDTVYSLFFDRAQNLWLGTNGSGLHRFDPRSQMYKNVASDDPDKAQAEGRVTAIFNDSKGRLWTAYYNNGVSRTNLDYAQLKRYKNAPEQAKSIGSNIVNSIYEDQEGNLWFCTNDGLSLYREQYDDFTTIRASGVVGRGLSDWIIYSIGQDQKGRLWIGTYNHGLVIWDRKSDQWTYLNQKNDREHGLSNNLIYSIATLENGDILAGTAGGLNRIDPETMQVKRYKHHSNDPTSLSNDLVRSIFVDRDKNVWVGTAGGGLNLFDARLGSFQSITKAHGLSGNSVVSLSQDSTAWIYVGTTQGLSRLDPDSKSLRRITLPADQTFDEISTGAAGLVDGRVIVGRSRGSTIIDSSFANELSFSQVLIHQAWLDGAHRTKSPPKKDISSGQVGSSNLSAQFCLIDLTQASPARFQWILEGFDKNWSEPSNFDSVRYTNLGAGDYSFRVRTVNDDGTINNNSDSIFFTITPHVLMSWWALLIYATLIAALILFFLLGNLRWQFFGHRKKNKQLMLESERLGKRLAWLENHDEHYGVLKRKNFLETLSHTWHHVKPDQNLSLISLNLPPLLSYVKQGRFEEAEQVMVSVSVKLKQHLAKSAVFALAQCGSIDPYRLCMYLVHPSKTDVSQAAEELRQDLQSYLDVTRPGIVLETKHVCERLTPEVHWQGLLAKTLGD